MNNSNENKKERVEQMFDAIAPRYDMLNHLLSFGIDNRWRRQVAKLIKKHNAKNVLDVATGTGDLLIAIDKQCSCQILGLDLSAEMVEIGRKKLTKRGVKAQMMQGDAENLPFESGSFDAVTCAFGVRNFGDIKRGVSEFYRVSAPGALCAILEYSPNQQKGLWNSLFRFYFKRVLPFVGGVISGNRAAYRYLPDSVDGFYAESEFVELMSAIGFEKCKAKSIMGGVVTLYTGYVAVR